MRSKAVAEQKDAPDRRTTEAPQPPPAQEWGQREDEARIIASGGKEGEKSRPDEEQRP
jgi:hypothetical protein